MLRRIVVVISFVTFPFVAGAQPAAEPTWIVGAGVGIGGVGLATDNGDPFSGTGGVVYSEALFRPAPRVPVYLRAMFAGGARQQNNAWWTARLGGEYRPCNGTAFCFVFGADLGYLHVDDVCRDASTDLCDGTAPPRNGTTISGRAGIDAGWKRVRVRATVDATRAFAADRFTVVQYGAPQNLGSFASFELGVAVAF
jgi:hypothetical protein